jgi:hypothetical protein
VAPITGALNVRAAPLRSAGTVFSFVPAEQLIYLVGIFRFSGQSYSFLNKNEKKKTYFLVTRGTGVVEVPLVLGLFKNVQMQGAQKPNREAYMKIR